MDGRTDGGREKEGERDGASKKGYPIKKDKLTRFRFLVYNEINLPKNREVKTEH